MRGSGDDTGIYRRVVTLGGMMLIALISCGAPAAPAAPVVAAPQGNPPTLPIKVQVTNTGIKTAIAQVRGTTYMDDLADGVLALQECLAGQEIAVWAPGFRIARTVCDGTSPRAYVVGLTPFSVADQPGYAWLDSDARNNALQACETCHSLKTGRREFTEWLTDKHSKTVTDSFYWTMYTGMSALRGQGSVTRWEVNPSGHRSRQLNPSPTGPGFLLDYPSEVGTCGYCHTPSAMVGPLKETNYASWMQNLPTTHASVNAEGIGCDICHKVLDVVLDEKGFPYQDKPGVLSFTLARPESGRIFFVGPFVAPLSGAEYPPPVANGVPVETTCAPVFSESAFCAACHYGKFYDTLVYGSYAEWLESAYSLRYLTGEDGQVTGENPEYRSCQDCHMLRPEVAEITLPAQRAACSSANHLVSHFRHDMLADKAADAQPGQTLIKDAATLVVESGVDKQTNTLHVVVKTINDKAGHKLPTDSPLRHMILVLEARDESGKLLPLVSGEVVPMWGGVAATVNGMLNYGGLPGKIFANVLMDIDTNETPTAAYWNPTRLLYEDVVSGSNADTRLNPVQRPNSRKSNTDTSNYFFAMPAMGDVTISVKLVYRFAFIDLAQKKNWYRPDVIVAEAICHAFPVNPAALRCAGLDGKTP